MAIQIYTNIFKGRIIDVCNVYPFCKGRGSVMNINWTIMDHSGHTNMLIWNSSVSILGINHLWTFLGPILTIYWS